MRSYIAGFNRTSLTPVIFVLLFVPVLGASVITSRSLPEPQKNELPQVKNETESFQLVSVEKSKEFLILRLRNASPMSITAYSVSLGRNGARDVERIHSDRVIAPGAIEEVEISLSEIPTPNALSARERSVGILAVVFEDQSSEGDFEAAAIIINTRLGNKIQLKRINRLISAALRTPDANLPAVISKLRTDIASLPETLEAGQHQAVGSGLYDAKEDALYWVEQLDRWQQSGGKVRVISGEISDGANLREGLEKVIKEQEKRIARYSAAFNVQREPRRQRLL